tara:strand:- start:951 stop:1313 length:363 start_codon:yes stop_codon:yes gene_type:complete
MATLTAKLTLSSSNTTSDALNLTVSETVSVGEPSVNLSRVSVATDAATNLRTTSDSSVTYIYLKNMDSTNIITVKTDGAVSFLDLSPGEFAFLPLKGAIGMEVQANTAACILEYGYWTKS